MKYVVLTIVGVWFAVVTVVQSFHMLSPLVNVILYSVTIGFGYTMFLVSMIDRHIQRMQAITIILMLFFASLFLGLFHLSFLLITCVWWMTSGLVLLFLHLTRLRKV